MTEGELKRLKKAQLLDIMLELSRINRDLEDENKRLKEKLNEGFYDDKAIGRLTDASKKVTGILNEADVRAIKYLGSVKASTQKEYESRISQLEEICAMAERIVRKAEKEKEIKIKKYDEYMENLMARLEKFYQEQMGFKESVEGLTNLTDLSDLLDLTKIGK